MLCPLKLETKLPCGSLQWMEKVGPLRCVEGVLGVWRQRKPTLLLRQRGDSIGADLGVPLYLPHCDESKNLFRYYLRI